MFAVLSQARIIIMPDIFWNVKPYLAIFESDFTDAVLHSVNRAMLLGIISRVSIFRYFCSAFPQNFIAAFRFRFPKIWGGLSLVL